jgi:hypothetical protein
MNITFLFCFLPSELHKGAQSWLVTELLYRVTNTLSSIVLLIGWDQQTQRKD